tara:strand:+ start:95 stop:316 length:222 start_codon:yes stop_codon:yes gene_type:complete
MNNKEQIQELLNVMKVEGRKPHLVEKMRILMNQRSFKPAYTEKPIEKSYVPKNTYKPVISYPSVPPHIRRRNR